MTDKNTFVTQPSLPPLEEFIPYLNKIWDSKLLTNSGPFHDELELALTDYLGVKFISLYSNATIALMSAIKFFNITDEIITTPFSFVATSHAILWNNATPIFVDIDPITCNLDPLKIEKAITSKTKAILAVHCYGNPCDYDSIKKIATKYNLKVIYDAAHAFAVNCDCGSILQHGDLSVLSFHATKVFNTFEGGAIISPDLETKIRIDQLKNFGFVNEVSVNGSGINGKMSEFNAALGLLQLKHIDSYIKKRSHIDNYYRKCLQGIKGIRILDSFNLQKHNFSYFPIFIENSYPISRDELYEKLKTIGIFARRYFYPLIPEFSEYAKKPLDIKAYFPNAYNLSREVLCLPIFPDLDEERIFKIVNFIKSNSN
jgi:dTDP-4-amino-4,6-dideoxygalactose transaminase